MMSRGGCGASSGGAVVGVVGGSGLAVAVSSRRRSCTTNIILPKVLPLHLMLLLPLLLPLLLVSTIPATEAFHLLSRHGNNVHVHRRSLVLLPAAAATTTTSSSPVKSSSMMQQRLQMTSDGNSDYDNDEHTKKKKKMERPFFDHFIASTLFRLEMDRVKKSSVLDEKGRVGEPMEWSQSDSIANKFSELVARNDLGYQFKQWVADIVAGNDYDQDEVSKLIDDFIAVNNNSNQSDDDDGGGLPVVAMFSFSTCPFCRRAKDLLESKNVPYKVMELDELEGNRGNEIRAMLGRRTRRTSVPSIFIDGEYIGGCNDGNPGLIPLEESGQLDVMLQKKI